MAAARASACRPRPGDAFGAGRRNALSTLNYRLFGGRQSVWPETCPPSTFDVRFEATRAIPATPEALWPLVADTERINRATGLPAVRYSPRPQPGGGSVTSAEYRIGPLTLARWTEEPFQWAAPRFYDVVRRYHWGPIASFHGGVELIPIDAHATTVRVWGDLEPRLGPLGWLVVRLVGALGITRGIDQVEQFGTYLSGESDSPFPTLERGDVPTDSTLRAPWDRLSRIAATPELVERLRQHLAQAADLDVLNMRPLRLADAWQMDRLDVLSLFLHATQAGIVVMHWDVLCPHCLTAKARSTSLAHLEPNAFCASCATAYEVDFDRNVELRFDVSPTLRRAQANTYCEGGPMNTPHLLARRVVGPNAVTTLQGDLAPGRYRIVSRQSAGSVVIDAAPQPTASLTTRVISVYADRMGPDGLGLPPGPTTLSLVSHLGLPATVDLERADWPDTIATAALVSTLGTFRDLFSTEVLAAGQQVAIGRLTFLAAGVAEPAALYAALGQGRAFKLIEACLRGATSIIGVHHGAVTGTLGERLLATFSSVDDAVGAALTLQRASATLVDDRGVDTARLLQVSVHEGPCLSATVAGRLGYFGVTPLMTLSLLDSTSGGDVLLSDEVAADPRVNARITDVDLVERIEVIPLAGASVRVHRLRTRQRRSAAA